MSQFAFLQGEWSAVYDSAVRAESAVHADPRCGFRVLVGAAVKIKLGVALLSDPHVPVLIRLLELGAMALLAKLVQVFAGALEVLVREPAFELSPARPDGRTKSPSSACRFRRRKASKAC